MANNFRLRNQLGQFIAAEDSDTATSYTVQTEISEITFEDYDHEQDPIENLEELNLNAVHLNVPLPVTMAFNLNPYNGDINPITNEPYKLMVT